MRISPWYWLAWALVGFTMEMIALFNKVPNDTLTATLVNYFPPAWIILSATVLLAHFVKAVRSKGHER